MEQDVDNSYRPVCCTCLSSGRDLFALNNPNLSQAHQIFRLLMYDYAGDRLGDLPELEQLICWECLALMKKFARFKWQVHSAQEHLSVLALNRSQETLDHTYMSQSLSSLVMQTKNDYDKIYFEFSTTGDDCKQYITMTTAEDVKNEHYDVAHAVRDNINLGIETQILEVPEIVLDNVTGVMSHIFVDSDAMVSTQGYTHLKADCMPQLTVEPITAENLETVFLTSTRPKEEKEENAVGYIVEYMTEEEMLNDREEAKQKIQYTSSVYKCELCIIGFYTQQQVEDHFVMAHRARPGHSPCSICHAHVATGSLATHAARHYRRYTCVSCGRAERTAQLARAHALSHSAAVPRSAIKIGDSLGGGGKGRKKKEKDQPQPPPKPGDLRKLLSKTTIEGYQCLECDMFFKNSRARRNHVARYHREGLQCDHCKKRFVNRTTLATHLRLHEGPLPRDECPICHKMVRSIQLKYHVQRHENKCRYECADCNKMFSHLTTYQAHLKYSRAHASDQVLKFPCPICNKGYPTKEAMQDHFNYQHLGKTSHKCPICDKPIASRANVEKHIMRVHGEKKEKPRNHICQTCRKPFTDRKALAQHEVVHSGERPLACDICQQKFKQKASLYTHRKRVHKVFPVKRVVEFMDTKPDGS